MNNCELIQHVKIRRALWDKSLWDRIDGSAREVMWEDIAEQMKSRKEIVKARWKNLRDSYRKLLIRVSGNPSIEGYPRWRHFQQLDFIKDIVINTKSKVNDISLKNSEIVSLEPDYSLTFESDVTEDPLSFTNEPPSSSSQPVRAEGTPKQKILDDSDTPDISSKFESGDKSSNDDDLQFLLSLHPHFKRVSMNKKLLLRMKIEKLIYDEIYSAENSSHNYAFKS